MQRNKTFNLNILILWDSSDLMGEIYVITQIFKVTQKREESRLMQRWTSVIGEKECVIRMYCMEFLLK